MSTCDGCHASVTWLPNNKTGKRAPVNVLPDPMGNVVIEDGKYRVLKKAEVANVPMFDAPERYTLHFATCTTPEAFRRRDQKAHRERNAR